VVVVAAGCGAPFEAVRPSATAQGVTVRYCGSSDVSPDAVVRAMEPPSSLTPEVGGSPLPGPEELRVCLRLENRGTQPARVDRSYLQLRAPREKQSWVPDSDDQEVIAHPGQTRELHVTFHYTPLVAGEDVSLVLDDAVTVGGRAAHLPPVLLRKR
jgi:hypothetical protein